MYELNFKTIISGAMITPVNMIPPPPTNISFHQTLHCTLDKTLKHDAIQNHDCLQEYDKLASTAVAAMCIECRTIHNSIGRVLEMPDTRITDCQAGDT